MLAYLSHLLRLFLQQREVQSRKSDVIFSKNSVERGHNILSLETISTIDTSGVHESAIMDGPAQTPGTKVQYKRRMTEKRRQQNREAQRNYRS